MPSHHTPYAINVRGLTKSFGGRRAVDALSFTVRPGRITGFLGPNGAGKTTTLRMLLGLVRPTGGAALIGEHRYEDLPAPARTVGALLEADGFHPGRTGRDHLRTYAPALGADDRRVDEVLAQVGLDEDAARRTVRGYSLGMRQRLGIAAALLPDPPVLICDEPTNGLDPEGIRWLRGLLRERADRGHTVLVSSHLLAEMQQIVDSVVIIDKGRVVYDGDVAAVGEPTVRVRALDGARLAAVLTAAGAVVEDAGDGALRVRGAGAEQIARTALREQVVVTELVGQRHSLEDLFFSLTEPGAGQAPATIQETAQ
ncbi:ABC transporter ATP-binding protein [Tomitella fengzijianii]|uniref:ABC transporter ATP-binding protein n=1 Tax=Tomitella fengzijianii TaxID=2597660 RepID=UPI00131E6382|nr:ABC transporter ATP-binding protein [Tomitella fengzijianii]